jgi:uncharacterized protein YjbI with pentapeptide repeats
MKFLAALGLSAALLLTAQPAAATSTHREAYPELPQAKQVALVTDTDAITSKASSAKRCKKLTKKLNLEGCDLRYIFNEFASEYFDGNLRGINLRKTKISYYTLLSGYDLTSAKVQKANWNSYTVYLNGAILDRADFTGSTLKYVWFPSASAQYAKFKNTKINSPVFSTSRLDPVANFSYADFTNAKFSWDNLLPGVAIKDALEGVNFTGAIFTGANLTAEDLSLAILTGATMPDGSIHP